MVVVVVADSAFTTIPEGIVLLQVLIASQKSKAVSS